MPETRLLLVIRDAGGHLCLSRQGDIYMVQRIRDQRVVSGEGYVDLERAVLRFGEIAGGQCA